MMHSGMVEGICSEKFYHGAIWGSVSDQVRA